MKSATRFPNDPVNLAKIMADIADRSNSTLRLVSGSIDGVVTDDMYDTMRGGFRTDDDVLTLVHNRKEGDVHGRIVSVDDRRSKVILDALAAVYDARIAHVLAWPVDDYASFRAGHTEDLRRVSTGRTMPMQPQDHAQKPVGKVGNFIGMDMRELERVPQTVRELLLLQRAALRSIGVTALSITAKQESVGEAGNPIDMLNAMAVVMESHLETRILRDRNTAYLSYFTCGDAKHPLPAARFLHRKLRPEQSMLHMIDRGQDDDGNGGYIAYIEDDFDHPISSEPLPPMVRL